MAVCVVSSATLHTRRLGSFRKLVNSWEGLKGLEVIRVWRSFCRTFVESSRRGSSPSDRQSCYRRRAVPCNLASFVCSTIASRDERRRYRCVCQCYDSTDNEKQFAQLPSVFLRLCWCAHQRDVFPINKILFRSLVRLAASIVKWYVNASPQSPRRSTLHMHYNWNASRAGDWGLRRTTKHEFSPFLPLITRVVSISLSSTSQSPISFFFLSKCKLLIRLFL